VTEIAFTAVVHPTAQLGNDVTIGPGCVVGPDSVIGDGCQLKMNVVIGPRTTLGRNNLVFANAVIGEDPQVLSLRDPPTTLIVGDDNVFRENVNISRGSPDGGGKTVIGDKNYFMVGVHLGHDVQVEDSVVMTNYCQIAGHVKIERNVWLSAFSSCHQFVTVGRFTYAAGFSAMGHDQPPFVRVEGAYPCEVRSLNTIGLRRAGISEESIDALDRAFRRLFRRRNGGTLAAAVAEVAAEPNLDENVRYLVEFLQRASQHRMGRYRELFRH
jgi:UDP-N-acetylglucosamine acyltransferase